MWTIENFVAQAKKGKLTFPTKFDMVDSILNLDHQGKIIVRMSVNPQEVISKIEIRYITFEKQSRSYKQA